MKIYRLFSALLGIIVIACLFGAQGQFQEQYVTPSSGYSTAAPNAAQNSLQYSQFYTMTTGSAPSNPIGAPQQYEIAGNMPSTVYLGEQMQSVPYSQYQYYPAFTGANSLWIKGATDWTQYAVVPQGATVSLFAISPTGGSGSLTFVDSDGQTYSHNYIFYPNSLLTFYADTIGRHTLSFAINGQSSSQVVIDVTGAYTQPSNYPEYYPWSTWYYGYNAPSTPSVVTTPSGNPGGKPGDHTGDHNAGNPSGNPGGKPGDHTGDHNAGNPSENPGGKPGDHTGDHNAGNPSGNPGGKPGDHTGDYNAGNPSGNNNGGAIPGADNKSPG